MKETMNKEERKNKQTRNQDERQKKKQEINR